MVALQGRVFDRFRQFQQLAPEVQAQVSALTESLATSKTFTKESAGLLRSVVGVKSDRLVDAIVKQLSVEKDEAKSLADALVLSGFLSVSNEKHEEFAKKLDKFTDAKTIFVPTDAKLGERGDETSVWSVRDGAIQAGVVKRPGKSFFGPKDAYAVANEKSKTLFFFENDYAEQLTDKVDLGEASVQFDDSIENGVKVSNAVASVVVGVSSKEMQNEWLNSIINAGATYREAFNVDTEAVKSIYELKDFDMQGKEVSMDKYKGKVLLVVNVSSKCGLTPTNYPELAELDKKYRDQGLEILAFPCNQFASQEPGTHEEIMEFVKKYNCEFPFFEKSDVNGADARPVFTYLKAKLPGSFGNFVKWNFTKFLVDRNGQPYKRFAPKDLPFSFEDDIKALLEQKPSSL
ncbi:Phospholipid hydroperoxide glutathione [Globisporangium polare]